MKSTPEWHKLMVWKAKKQNISIDSLVLIDATFVAEKELRRRGDDVK